MGAVAFAPACSSDDTTGDGDGTFDGSGGVVSSGGTPSGGDGDGDTGGTPPTGDGDGDTGGMPGDGDGDTGGAEMGGMGGGLGGMGGGGSTLPTVGCNGCAIFHVPFPDAWDTDENPYGIGTDFEINLGDASTADLSATTLTVRLQVVMEGNAGGVQFYVKNGDPQGYASKYSGWNNLTDATSDFIEISIDLSGEADPNGDSFSKSAVQFIGVNVATGSPWDGAIFDDVYVFIDSITFSDGALTDMTFDTDSQGIAVNEWNSPIAGSAIFHE